MRGKGYATVRLKLDGMGLGTVVVNGVHMGKYVSGTRFHSRPGEPMVVTLSILADDVEVDAIDAKTVIDWLTPEDLPPPEHLFVGEGPLAKCSVCKQLRRVAAPICPGPLK